MSAALRTLEHEPASTPARVATPAPASRRDAWIVALVALVAAPLAAHLAFSRFGFHPTDDGFVLAYARRLLDGEVPHRDFVSIRPVGSALLHAPWLVLGGDHALLLARFVAWCELALVAWCGVTLAQRLAGRAFGVAHALALFALAFALGAHTFPVMPWHTLDAIALACAGLVLAASPRTGPKAAGYVLLGAAVLCRQNFLPLAPLAALLLGDRRRAWVAACFAAPLAVYALALAALGALPDALAQLGATTGLQSTAITVFFRHPWTLAGVLAGSALALLQRRAPAMAEAGAWLAVLLAATTLPDPNGAFADVAAFALLGVALGLLLAHAHAGRGASGAARFAALVLAVAWCASISIGLNTPALAAGLLALVPLVTLASSAHPSRDARAWTNATRAAAALLVLGTWAHARLEVIYRDRPASELTSRLDGVLPGGAGIVTNARTAALLADLDRAVAATHGRPYAIVCDFAAWWAKAPARNPLPVDWAQAVELPTPALEQRVIAALEAQRLVGVVLVQKRASFRVADDVRAPATGRYYAIADWVRGHFTKAGETAEFELYR